MDGNKAMVLPEGFRKLEPARRRDLLHEILFGESAAKGTTHEDFLSTGRDESLIELASLMVESSIGYAPIPLGIAHGFLIDGIHHEFPMATEEPSVIAAASYAARIIAKCGGFITSATDPVMVSQIFLEGVDEAGIAGIREGAQRIRQEVQPFLGSLPARGGGFREMSATRLPETGLVRVDLLVDVRDAMGANILNSVAEGICPLVESLSGGKRLMCILSNAATERRGRAGCVIPFDALERISGSGFTGAEIARRISLATDLANEDPSRAVTHNKGVMNGISALALATFNDCRSIEAAAHAWAARSGAYRSLSSWKVDGRTLVGELELPLSFGAVGGAAAFHPASRLALRMLGNPGAMELARMAAALGLAQNFAALLALVTGGIQRGHMRYHAPRIAYQAGARGAEIESIASAMTALRNFSHSEAEGLLANLRAGLALE
ncbi:MAG: hydroxymethylglutaryl-CoA reductase, degradative [Spirochaetota bacterium]